ncbi:hypothetical protein KEJ19_05605 [Candidatus Bathyarchaeota archaeon]|nr:hypothetical protein [Candidatus Bathyarchaeota archaeon]
MVAEERPRPIRRKPSPFSSIECKGCPHKGSYYCWRQCPFNAWRTRRVE